MSKEKIKMVVWFLIVIIVVGGLVLITINNKGAESVTDTSSGTGQENMQNTQQVEGVKITIVKEGTGAQAKSGDTVAMNYTGKLVDGTVFDSNVDPKFNHVQPFVFSLGAGQVIKGWDVGVAGMKVGEKRILEINPDYGYGATGAGGVIPPNATLVFDVELLGIKE
ncbi:MAG: FKBP-type peptidyl-prolyl cis-trans isomerase [Candidatus Paceibacterota bacterium]